MNTKELFTIGVEEEFMICHPETFDLTSKAKEIMKFYSRR